MLYKFIFLKFYIKIKIELQKHIFIFYGIIFSIQIFLLTIYNYGFAILFFDGSFNVKFCLAKKTRLAKFNENNIR